MNFLETFWHRFRRRFKALTRSFAVVAVMSLSIGILSQGALFDLHLNLKEGDIAPRNIKAPEDIKVIDEALTEKRRESVASSVRDVFDFDSEWSQRTDDKLNQILQALDKGRGSRAALSGEIRANIEKAIGAALNDIEWKLISQTPFARALRAYLSSRFESTQRPWVFREVPSNTVTLRDVKTGEEMIVSRTGLETQSQSLDSLRSEIILNIQSALGIRKLTRNDIALLQSILGKVLSENVSFNPIETAARKDEAKQKIEVSWAEIKKGEIVLREGQRIEKKHLLLLQSVSEARSSTFKFSEFISISILFAFVTILLVFVGRRNFKKFKLTFRDQLVLGGFLVLSVALLTGLYSLFKAAEDQTLIASLLLFALPLGFTGMTLRLFTSMEITTFCLLLQSVALAWVMDDAYFAFTGLLVSLSGAALMRRISERRDVFKAGLLSGFAFAVLTLIGATLDIPRPHPFESLWAEVISVTLLCFCSGALSAGFVLALQPLLENLGYTTDLRLMELSRSDHPLLKDLILRAPGTYFHSFTVSQLAEKAAEAIQANALFARVASLYHDIGKIKKPQYFIENIKGENKHDKLAPTMSALIISNHVKEGIELGMEHKLPISLIEVIPQHHGTALISYFYDKARKAAGSEGTVEDRDFRYPGPKPQTKEAAIIMMADAVEATAKSMANASEDQLKQMVHATIQRFFLDEQLDECDLSLKDLATIGQAFLQVLQGVYHHRIEYTHLKQETNPGIAPLKPSA